MKGKIFIIDDDTTILEGMKCCLELEGYEVGVAASAMAAAFLLRRFDPDVILLDLNMPALGGERLLSLDRARTFPPRSLVILWSGREDSELAPFAEKAGADGFHSKGSDFNLLLTKLQRWVSRAQARQSGASAETISENIIVLRTNGQTTTAADLEAGGYIVVEAASDEEAVERLQHLDAVALVVQTSFYAATRFLQTVQTEIPVIVMSAFADQIASRFPFVRPLTPRLPRYDLIAAIDRILVRSVAPGLLRSEA